MVTARLFVKNDEDIERVEVLTESDLEWILNSLRAMQERQQGLAAESRDHTITARDIGEGSSTPEAEIHVGQMFEEQFNDITELREKIVLLCGRDLTDG